MSKIVGTYFIERSVELQQDYYIKGKQNKRDECLNPQIHWKAQSPNSIDQRGKIKVGEGGWTQQVYGVYNCLTQLKS